MTLFTGTLTIIMERRLTCFQCVLLIGVESFNEKITFSITGDKILRKNLWKYSPRC